MSAENLCPTPISLGKIRLHMVYQLILEKKNNKIHWKSHTNQFQSKTLENQIRIAFKSESGLKFVFDRREKRMQFAQTWSFKHRLNIRDVWLVDLYFNTFWCICVDFLHFFRNLANDLWWQVFYIWWLPTATWTNKSKKKKPKSINKHYIKNRILCTDGGRMNAFGLNGTECDESKSHWNVVEVYLKRFRTVCAK